MLKPGVRQRVRVSKHTGRRAPLEFSEAAERWARKNGTHAKVVWLDNPMNCWAVVLAYKDGDPRKETGGDGEKVLLHEYWSAEDWARKKPHLAKRHPRTNRIMPGSYAYDLMELGVEGMLAFLDKSNILSGRGEFAGAEDAADKQRKAHAARNERRRAQAKDDAGHRARDIRRSAFKIPFLPVGIEFSKERKSA